MSSPRLVRRLPRTAALMLWVFLGALVASCGGGSATVPPSGAAASLTIASGNGQSAAPGSALPVRLSVLVKDAAGSPVSGVTVQFKVESGGGSLSITSSRTGADGVATSGIWTLGNGATSNIVSATVTGLAPVQFTATTASVAVVLDQTQSTAGGTLTVSKPGDAVDGLQIVVKPASFAAAVHWQVSERPNTELPQRPGLNPVSPLITIHTGVGTYADSGILVRIPAVITPGYFAMAFYYDKSDGTIEALPLVKSDANSVTIMTRHFSAASMLRTGGAAGALRAALPSAGIPAVGEVDIVISQIDPTGLNQDISSAFRAATDGWEVQNPSGWAISAGGHCAGWSMTAIWYYYTQRNAVGALYNRFSTDPAVWQSDVRGWRWADLAWGDVNWENYAKVLIPALVAQYNPTPALPATLAVNEQRALAYAIKVTGMPQYLGLTNSQGGGHAVVAYRVANNTVYYADPNRTGVEVSGTLGTDFSVSGENWVYQMMIGVSSFVPFDKIAARWQTFQDKTIGNAEYPAMPIEQAVVTGTDTTWFTTTDTIWTPDATVRLRTRCPICPAFAGGLGDGSIMRSLGVTNATATTAVAIPFLRDPVTANPIFNSTPPYHEEYAIATSAPVSHFGALLAGLRTDANGGGRAMVDYRPITILYTQGTINPAAPVLTPGTLLSLTYQLLPSTLPPHVTYRWDFGDNKPKTTVQDNPNVQYTWDNVGNYLVKCEILDVRNNQVIARATTTATVHTRPIWRFTTLTLTSEVGPAPVSHQNPAFDQEQPALAGVKAAMGQVATTPNEGLILYFNQAYRDSIGPAPLGAADNVWIQVAPAGTGATVTGYVIDPRYTEYYPAQQCSSNCSGAFITSTGTLLSGTVAGLGQVSPRFPICIGNAGVCTRVFIASPWNWWEISATMNGATLTGTIRFTQEISNDAPDPFGQYAGNVPSAYIGAHIITWTFSAKMVP